MKEVSKKIQSVQDTFDSLYQTKKKHYEDSINYVEAQSETSCWLPYNTEKIKEIDRINSIFHYHDKKSNTKEKLKYLRFVLETFKGV